MLFSEKYPDMVRIHEVKDGIMRGNEARPCSICGRLTEYIEINYEGHFCSDECVDEMDRMEEEYIRKMDRKEIINTFIRCASVKTSGICPITDCPYRGKTFCKNRLDDDLAEILRQDMKEESTS